ncbi:hypothetical protein ZIOFF_057149 [Zingiber officinale]|uniref:Cytochrome b5 heme-binding domain-containing protein n=2 Tax=Zingiber officinale TaxID=94328 RepID=A0A8J5F2Q5_ZINOF|nr:hypothetical protein ZIOFF_057149 [Zingiber officinale]
MKLGPCLRNSVVSPNKGHPMVPGGRPFFLYLTSFHLNKAPQMNRKQSSGSMTNTTIFANKQANIWRRHCPYSSHPLLAWPYIGLPRIAIMSWGIEMWEEKEMLSAITSNLGIESFNSQISKISIVSHIIMDPFRSHCAGDFDLTPKRARERSRAMATLSKLYSMREAAEHNTREDCWVVIDGKVYDVTSYLDEHPGGDDVLLSAAGRDSTEDFEEVGHSNDARELMKAYCVGELDPDHAVIPELEVFRKDQSSGFTNKLKNITLEYWAATAVIGIAVVAGILYSRKS